MTERTLRDEFAMAALSGAIKQEMQMVEHELKHLDDYDYVMPINIATVAYTIADAMLAERAKAPGFTAVSNFTVPGGNNDQ